MDKQCQPLIFLLIIQHLNILECLDLSSRKHEKKVIALFFVLSILINYDALNSIKIKFWERMKKVGILVAVREGTLCLYEMVIRIEGIYK